MKFVLIFGPQAVGKMTVGRELEKLTGLKLFHNHMTLEMLAPLFGFGPETWRLSDLFRKEIFEAAARSEMDGMIFTYVWAFDQPSDWAFVDEVCGIFESKGADVYLVELEADIKQRLERNKTPYRLEQKPSKRDVEHSEQDLIKSMEQYRLNSFEGEIQRANYVKIDNSSLSPEETAERIALHFGF